ncbi:MAG: MoaD/ThiS family protein [Planctomycetes bacterium]|nr:MoaD/ThiS family protein [Planctomycetota bacterium]
MKIKVKLFASLTRYLPPDSKNRTAELEVPEGVTAGGVLDQLGVPEKLTHLTMVNGVQQNRDSVLREGDLLSVFPPVAGGLGRDGPRAHPACEGRHECTRTLQVSKP